MTTAASAPAPGTIDPAEVAQFAALAHEWWNERGPFAPLHRLNPLRVGFIRDAAIRRFARADQSATPLDNLSLLDVGCGGGLVCEPMARLGAHVTGADASPTNTGVAATHAKASGLTIDYRASTAEELADQGQQYDIVLALEIIEHVADTALFYDALAALVKPGGLLVMSTLNRTAKSYALGIVGAEYILRWLPRGTHQWQRFIKPSEMAADLTRRGFALDAPCGITFNPLSWKFALNPRDLEVNYLLSATKNA